MASVSLFTSLLGGVLSSPISVRTWMVRSVVPSNVPRSTFRPRTFME
jgi:hypothetical protein